MLRPAPRFDHLGELALAQQVLVPARDVRGEAGHVHQLVRGLAVSEVAGTGHAHGDGEAVADHPDREHEVAVVRDHERHVAEPVEGVHEQPGREVHVRTLLLVALDLREARSVREGIAPHVRFELPQVDREVGQGFEREEVRPLARRLGVARVRGEVANVVQPVVGEQRVEQAAGQRGHVQPAVRSALQAAVVEVEAVDVHADAGRLGHGSVSRRRVDGRRKKRPPLGDLGTGLRSDRRCRSKYRARAAGCQARAARSA